MPLQVIATLNVRIRYVVSLLGIFVPYLAQRRRTCRLFAPPHQPGSRDLSVKDLHDRGVAIVATTAPYTVWARNSLRTVFGVDVALCSAHGSQRP